MKHPEQTEQSHGLRPIVPDTIVEYFSRHFEDSISVTVAPKGTVLTVPEGWYGAGKTGEAIVLTGKLLIEPVAGTELSPYAFARWLADRGFTFSLGDREIGCEEAAERLASDQAFENDVPVFRAVRSADQGTPVEIELFNGSRSLLMQGLTMLGNRSTLAEGEKDAYRQIVARLLAPHLIKGTTRVRQELGVGGHFRKIRYVDDCAAAATTVVSDMLLQEQLGKEHRDRFEVVDVAVATTQAMTILTLVAERRGVPLLIRAGGPSFGLAGPDKGMNYMYNTQPEMLALGSFTSGDFGENMADAKAAPARPTMVLYGNGTDRHETRFYLSGGAPIHHMMDRLLADDAKYSNGVTYVLRAARINQGTENWGVVMSGIHMSELQSKREIFLHPGTTLHETPSGEDVGETVPKDGMRVRITGEMSEVNMFIVAHPAHPNESLYLARPEEA